MQTQSKNKGVGLTEFLAQNAQVSSIAVFLMGLRCRFFSVDRRFSH